MNQILCGDTVIDTDDVQLAIKIEGEDAQRRVFLRGGRTAILRSEEEVAFDVWAATLPRAGAMRPLRIEQLTAMAYKQGRRAGRQEISAFFAKLATPSCQMCKVFDDDEERCTWTIGHVAFPKCHEAREEALEVNEKPLCKTCACYEVESGHCTELAGNHYPECRVASCELCERSTDGGETCARVYDEKFPGCFVERKEAAEPAGGDE